MEECLWRVFVEEYICGGCLWRVFVEECSEKVFVESVCGGVF